MSLSVKLAVVLACLTCAAATFSSAATAAKTPPAANTETMKIYEAQLAAGEIRSATFRPKSHSLHINLTDGHHADLVYAPSEAKRLRVELKAHDVALVSKSPGHKTIYIIGGIAIVVVVLLIAGFVIVRRRRAAADNY